jgi:hypothetical protein
MNFQKYLGWTAMHRSILLPFFRTLLIDGAMSAFLCILGP